MLDGEDQDNGSVEIGRRRDADRGGTEADARTFGSRYVSSGVHRNARMPVHRNSPFYNMKHEYRGMAIIFNHMHFDSKILLNSRTGTDVDSDNLSTVLEELGFQVEVKVDLTSEEIYEYALQIAVVMDHSKFDCLVIAVLTHGEHGMLYAKDSPYKADFLWQLFTGDKCPTLAGKPKLFFIQACQGDKFDVHDARNICTESDGIPSRSYKIPVHADILIVYSVVPGYLSWRDTTRGSWFVQALCEELCRGADRDILTILTFVSQRVAQHLDSYSLGLVPTDLMKQVPCITSMLTRKLVFGKK